MKLKIHTVYFVYFYAVFTLNLSILKISPILSNKGLRRYELGKWILIFVFNSRTSAPIFKTLRRMVAKVAVENSVPFSRFSLRACIRM